MDILQDRFGKVGYRGPLSWSGPEAGHEMAPWSCVETELVRSEPPRFRLASLRFQVFPSLGIP